MSCPVTYTLASAFVFGSPLVMDEVTPDVNGLLWGVERLQGWWDTEPVRFETSEAPGAGAVVTVARPLARTITLTAFAMGPGASAVGLAAFNAIYMMQGLVMAALEEPSVLTVADPDVTLSAFVRLGGVMKVEIVGPLQLVKFTIPFLAPDPGLF